MSDMPPTALLRAAAEKIRSLVGGACPGPWTVSAVAPYTDPLLMSRYEETPDDGEVPIVGNIDVEPADSDYIAAMHPGVGEALADWLDYLADLVESVTRKRPDAATADAAWIAPGLEVARRILGEGEAS